jgi:pyrophosphatase PpaX
VSRPDGPWEAVLFDFDGTLADTVPLIVASFRHTLADTDGELDELEVRGWIGRVLSDVLEERHPGRGDELVKRYREHNLAHHDTLIRRVPGAARLLDDLHAHGIPVAVVSSKSHMTVRRGMRVTGLREVEHVVGFEDTAAHKPDPAPLLEGAWRVGVAPGRCVYVGDALVDVLAAGAAGMTSIAVTWGAGTREVLQRADHVVDDAAELARLLLPARTAEGLQERPSRTT